MHFGVEHEIITIGGVFILLTHGPLAFFLMRFAHKVIEDPEYEEKVFNRTNRKR